MTDLLKSKLETVDAYLERLHATGVVSTGDIDRWKNGNEVNACVETKRLVVQVSPKTRTIPKIRFRDGEEVLEDESHHFSITELAYSLSSIKINVPKIESTELPEIWFNHQFLPIPAEKFEMELDRYIQDLIERSKQLPDESLHAFADRLVSLNFTDPTTIENWKLAAEPIAIPHVLELSALKSEPRRVHRKNGDLLEYEIAVPYTRTRRVLLLSLPSPMDVGEEQQIMFREIYPMA